MSWASPELGREPHPAGASGGREERGPLLRGRWRANRERERGWEPWNVRAGWTLAAAVLVLWGLRLAPAGTTFPWVTAVSVVILGSGLGLGVAAWVPGFRPGRWSWLALGLTLVAFAVWAYVRLYAAPGYGTDEIAFDQYAAHLLVHGLDPYRHSMAPAIARYHVSPDGFTYRLDGRPVTSLSYPALAFLLYAPLLALGHSAQAAQVVNLVAWGLALVLLFAVLPPALRPLAIVLGSLSVYVSYAAGGVTDALFVPFLIGAVASWDRFVTAQGWSRWRSPLLMGLALAVKQTPWFVLLFLLLALLLEHRRRGASWRRAGSSAAVYLGVAALAFSVPNIWFLAQDPGAWVQGVLSPFSSHVVPAGQGLVGLSLFLGVGGGSLFAYTVAAVLVLVALLTAQAATWPALRGSWVLLTSLVLFFATRSLGSYLVELLPVALVAAVTLAPLEPGGLGAAERGVRDEVGPRGLGSLLPGSGRETRWRFAAVAGTAILAAGGVALALTSSSPLGMKVVGVHSTGQLATIDRVVVEVRNVSGEPEAPHFTVDLAGSITTFWRASGGPAVLRPGQSASYTLAAPNAPAMPPISGGFQVLAFTQSPDTVSRSPQYVPSRDHLVLYPQAMNAPVPVGKRIQIRAAILNSFDQPVHEAGVPVYLGQIIYTERGPQPTRATIDGSLPGQTPVMALTNKQGVATFDVVGTVAGPEPTYFEANLLDNQDYYPYGYSPILMVYFVRPIT